MRGGSFSRLPTSSSRSSVTGPCDARGFVLALADKRWPSMRIVYVHEFLNNAHCCTHAASARRRS